MSARDVLNFYWPSQSFCEANRTKTTVFTRKSNNKTAGGYHTRFSPHKFLLGYETLNQTKEVYVSSELKPTTLEDSHAITFPLEDFRIFLSTLNDDYHFDLHAEPFLKFFDEE